MAYINGSEIFFSSVVVTIVPEPEPDEEHIIDVMQLPAENIDETAIYRLNDILYRYVDGGWIRHNEPGGPTGGVIYDGEYVITPSIVSDIILATAEKTLTADITVKKLPWSRALNASGGETVTIGT